MCVRVCVQRMTCMVCIMGVVFLALDPPGATHAHLPEASSISAFTGYFYFYPASLSSLALLCVDLFLDSSLTLLCVDSSFSFF